MELHHLFHLACEFRSSVGLKDGIGEAWHWIDYGEIHTLIHQDPKSIFLPVHISMLTPYFQSLSHRQASAMPVDQPGGNAKILHEIIT